MMYSLQKQSSDVFGPRVGIMLSIFRTSNILRRSLDYTLRDTPLTFATFRPLIYLMILPAPVSQKDIAHAMQLDVSAIVRILDLLVEWGTVSRVTDPDNRRANIVTITDKGYCLVEEIVQDIDSSLLKVFDTLSHDELVILSKVMTAIDVVSSSIKSNHA